MAGTPAILNMKLTGRLSSIRYQLCPFPGMLVLADTKCRRISAQELIQLKMKISAIEFENSGNFWNVEENEFDVYECLKTPIRHTLLISKTTKRVLHRIEFIG